MNNPKFAYLAFVIISVVLSSCQPAPQTEDHATLAEDTAVTAEVQPSESGYADVNGLEMYYEVYGNGKPIVLVHGSFMNIPLNWSSFIPLLSKQRKVIVTEMQGHGRTKNISREFSYENMSDDLSGLLKHLKIDSADILGYSMGGGVAFQFAVRHPEQLRRLVILSGTYAHDGWWPDVEASFAKITPEAFVGSPIQKQYDSLGNDPALFPEFVRRVISIDLKPYDWSRDVKKIQAPVFMAIGDVDGVKYDHAIEFFRAKGGAKMGDIHGLPKSRLAIIPATTHIGMMQRTDWLIPMITDFLDSDLSATPPTF
jgi:pimeloyl-ACP methyl ester carboxylesterase